MSRTPIAVLADSTLVSATKEPLTKSTFQNALVALSDRDPDLERVLATHGPPPMWVREPGFATLVHIVLEQQVSLASAKAAFDRLREILPELTPAEFLKLDSKELRRIGFSRQKSRYCRGVAESLVAGSLCLARLERMSDPDARAALLEITGVGPWTADIYLLMALRRPDAWPSGDLALARAAWQVKGLESPPSEAEMEVLGNSWRPWRAVAARILWHHYLSHSA